MRLLAISDLHLGDPVNRECFASIGASPDDWLILAGDVSETEADLALAFGHLRSRFARVIWVPGNHELWTTDSTPGAIRGEARYQALVALARSFGVVTPEDPYPIWPVSDHPLFIVPLFTLYDYTFRPDEVLADEVIAWAAEESSVCADEYLLHPSPYPTLSAWCAARVVASEARLAALPKDCATVLISHFPLCRSHAGCRACLGSPHGAAPAPLRRGPAGIAPVQLCMATCISVDRSRSTACSSMRCRWATHGNGTNVGRSPPICVWFFKPKLAFAGSVTG
jgi:hypothetical protein